MNTTLFQIEFVSLGVMYPDIKVTPRMVLAQAVHESANFTSHVYTENNNCFGMMAPSKRETTCTNKGQGGFAHYDSFLDCLRDYYLWCRYFNVVDNAALWLKIYNPSSKGGYAEDPKYSVKIAAQVGALDAANKYIEPKLILAGDATALGLAVVAAGFGLVELVA